MNVITRVLEAIAVVAPDFQFWGLISSVFFGLYYCAQVLGFSRTSGVDSGLLLSLLSGYIVNLILNLVSFWAETPARRFYNPHLSKTRNEKSVTPFARHSATTALPRYSR